MIPTITAFERSPDGGKGLARDTRVRWAFEEVGQPYDVRYVSFAEMKAAPYRDMQPFGQIPAYQDGEVTLFESGAIILHIAERHPGLLPADANARARAITWMFAAIGTVEPPILDLVTVRITEARESWAAARLPLVEARIHARLDDLAARLGAGDWLDGAFSAGDLMMAHVLQRLKPSGLLGSHPSLSDYVARAEARPAYRRAFAAQLTANARLPDVA